MQNLCGAEARLAGTLLLWLNAGMAWLDYTGIRGGPPGG